MEETATAVGEIAVLEVGPVAVVADVVPGLPGWFSLEDP